jgi:hypothetical protein
MRLLKKALSSLILKPVAIGRVGGRTTANQYLFKRLYDRMIHIILEGGKLYFKLGGGGNVFSNVREIIQ